MGGIGLPFHAVAYGQSGSLFQNPALGARNQSMLVSQNMPPNTMQPMPPQPGNVPWGMPGPFMDPQVMPPDIQSSFTFTPPVPARTLRINDLVSIRVEEIQQSLALGNTTSRKTQNFDAVLQDWIRLVGIDTIKPAPQSNGDPRVRFAENEVYRGDSTMRTNESLTFNIEAMIVDILPNGNLVLEASNEIEINDNRFKAKLTGICRAQDITADNTILSRNIYGKKIWKEDDGHVRDGYSRGWLTRWYARLKPF
jgi:flagellar L-ring protein precursor FlgH